MIVQVQEGQMQGVVKRSTLTGQPFYAFLGIPYAEPPIGDLRFQAPVPAAKWDEVLIATKEGSECLQTDMLTGGKGVKGSEDCLYLNVYTPKAPSQIKTKKAVMVYIHGGGFSFDSGTARIYGPDYLIGHDVIYVTLNYRLHVFGFLNAGTPSCPGNAGLKDQLLALKWIKKNIENFGGDPENITIFGESAGASSVQLQMLSPLSKGLFKKAIMQSGNALSPWAIEKDPESYARKIGILAGYRGEDMEGLIEYLKNQAGRTLCELADRCKADLKQEAPAINTALTFVPSVEKIKDGAFLPDYPEILLKSATPIPTIVGYTDQEGLLKLLSCTRTEIDSLMNDLSIVVKNNFSLDESQRAELAAKIKEFYFQNKSPTYECISSFVDMYTDLFFMKFYNAIDYLIGSDVPPYIYLFSHEGKANFFKNKGVAKMHPDLKIKGACHADDLGYLFSQTKFHCEMDEVDKKVMDHFCTLWTDFAKIGNPTSSLPHINWRSNTADHPCYLRIEETLQVFDEKLFEKRLDFWKKWTPNALR